MYRSSRTLEFQDRDHLPVVSPGRNSHGTRVHMQPFPRLPIDPADQTEVAAATQSIILNQLAEGVIVTDAVGQDHNGEWGCSRHPRRSSP